MFGEYPPVAGIAAVFKLNFAASNIVVGQTVPYTALDANEDLIGSLFIPVSAVSEPVPSEVCSHQTDML